MDIQHIFAKKLKYFLDLNQKTQKDLAKDLNIHTSVISTWCTGTAFPRADKIMLLSDYFNTDFINFFIDDNIDNNEYLNELISIASMLDDEYKELLLNQSRLLLKTQSSKIR
ncbi:MAG: helix-turn-helix transcriptional regulator [Bacilli bacterium]|nr:helix-turn-helix transcriptional regulator [Bacilli bacterium]